MTTLVSDPAPPGASIVTPGPQVVTLPSGATFQPSDISRDEKLPYAGASPFLPHKVLPTIIKRPDQPVGGYGQDATGVYVPPGGSQAVDIQSGQPTDLTKPLMAASMKEDPQAKANDYVTRTMAIEGEGKDPRSSAVGGFINSTWIDQMHKLHPETRGMPDDQVLAMRGDAKLRAQATAGYAAENSALLQKAGQPVTPTNLRLAHFLGPAGAVQVLTTDPYRLFSEINPKAVEANPTLQGRTVGEVIQLADDQINGTTRADLMRTSTGPFNAGAMPLLQEWQSDLARKSKEYDAALAEGKDLRTVARAAMEKWKYETDHPPQDMREAWNQYAAGAIGLALIGGFFGRNHTAAINAAGEMLQAANAADVRAYDVAYKKWKDHNDNGLKMIELLHGEARDIVNDAKNSYDMTLTKLSTLSTAYHLGQAMDPQSLENQIKQRQLVEVNSKIIEQQHDFEKKKQDEKALQSAVEDKDKQWLAEHPEANGVVPPNVHLQHEGEAKREVSGTASAASDAIKQQIYTNTLSAEVNSWLNRPENAGKTISDMSPEEYAVMQQKAAQASGYVRAGASVGANTPKFMQWTDKEGKPQTGMVTYDPAKREYRQVGASEPLPPDAKPTPATTPKTATVNVTAITPDGKSHTVAATPTTLPDGTKTYIEVGQTEPFPRGTTFTVRGTGQPRSAPAIFLNKWIEQHPDADAEAIAMAAARFRQIGAMEQAFGSGSQGNTIRSLNVAIDHTDVLDQLGQALENKDTQKINALKNRMLVEFGYEGPVDFDVAKKIVADEVVKSVLGNNAGTGAERLELQADFDRANSPEQLRGVINTARRLMLGQMRGLEYQYAGSDENRRAAFRDKLFEHTKETLESTDKAAKGGTNQGETLPPGIPAGSKKIGTYQGKDVYQAPDGSKWQP